MESTKVDLYGWANKIKYMIRYWNEWSKIKNKKQNGTLGWKLRAFKHEHKQG